VLVKSADEEHTVAVAFERKRREHARLRQVLGYREVISLPADRVGVYYTTGAVPQ
jgi:hypothetical protein